MTPRSIATYKTANAKYGMDEGWRVPGVRFINLHVFCVAISLVLWLWLCTISVSGWAYLFLRV